MPKEDFYGVVGLNPVGGYSGENIVESARVENMEVGYNFMYQATSPFSIDISYRFLAPAGGGVSITAFSFTVGYVTAEGAGFSYEEPTTGGPGSPYTLQLPATTLCSVNVVIRGTDTTLGYTLQSYLS